MVAASTSPGTGSGSVPPWLIRLGAISWRVLVVMALAAVLVGIAFTISTVSATIVISLIIAATFAPLVLALRARGWPAALSAAAVTLGTVLIVCAVIGLVAISFAPHIEELFRRISDGIAEAKSTAASIGLPTETADAVESAVATAESWIAAHVNQLVSDVATAVTVAILSIFLVFYLLSDGSRAWALMLGSTNEVHRDEIASSGHRAIERVGGYLRGMAILAAVMAVVEFAFLRILNVPLAAPLAVLVFMGGFIPYVGGLITTFVLVAVAAGTNGVETAAILLVLILILTFIRGKVLQPMIYGRSVDLHPAVVLLALPVGAAAAGVVGLFAAIPVVAFLMAVTGTVIAAIGPPDAATERDPVVPPWLDRLAQWSWRILVALGLLAVGIQLATQVPIVILPVIIGLILASTLVGVVEALERRGRSRAAAAAIATTGLTLIVIVVVAIALMQIAGPLNDAAATAVRGGSTVGASGGTATGWVEGATSQVSAGVVRVVRELGSGLAEFGVVLVLGVLLTFYCLRDGQRVWASKISRVSPWRRREISEAASRSVGVLGGYMAGTAVVSLVGAVSMFAIMVVLGIPYAVPVALLSFFLGFIPYIGGFIATAAAFLITASTGDTTDIVIMAIWTVVFNIVQGNVVSPLVYGRTVDLHPAIVLLAIPAGGQIAGVIGMFLVVPFLGVVSVSWRTVLRAAGDAPPVALATEPDEEVADDPAPGGGAARVPGGDAIEPAT